MSDAFVHAMLLLQVPAAGIIDVLCDTVTLRGPETSSPWLPS